MRCPSGKPRNTGVSLSQRGIASAQRERKLQPTAGPVSVATAPEISVNREGFASWDDPRRGTADIKARV
jgi:hypothetical protein